MSSQASLLPLHMPAVVVAGPNESDPSGYSKSAVKSEENSTSSQVEGTAYEPIEWTKVILAARVHSEASVSSPTIRFYQPGIALQVVSRQNGWLQSADPASQERGWVLEKYLASIEGPALTQTAIDAIPKIHLSEQVTAKPAFTGAKKRNRSSKRAPVRVSNDVAFAEFDPRNDRWSRRGDRRGGLGLFFFGRFARTEADAR